MSLTNSAAVCSDEQDATICFHKQHLGSVSESPHVLG